MWRYKITAFSYHSVSRLLLITKAGGRAHNVCERGAGVAFVNGSDVLKHPIPFPSPPTLLTIRVNRPNDPTYRPPGPGGFFASGKAGWDGEFFFDRPPQRGGGEDIKRLGSHKNQTLERVDSLVDKKRRRDRRAPSRRNGRAKTNMKEEKINKKKIWKKSFSKEDLAR